MSQTLLLILGGCLLGAIQLVVGIAIGVWLRQGNRAESTGGRHDLLQASEIAKRLRELTGEMSSSVGEHRTHLDRANQLLTAENEHAEAGLTQYVIEVISDIVRANRNLQSQLETAESRLAAQAAEIEAHISRSLTDPLTGLPNRRAFNERLEEHMSAWNRHKKAFSLLMLDVDHFKNLNDRLGHLAGDQALAEIGRILRSAVRREDAVARYGGEEFAVLLSNTPIVPAIEVMRKVRRAPAQTSLAFNGQEFSVTLSGGLAQVEDNEQSDSVIQRADAALYAAKAGGRDCAFLHDGVKCIPVDEFNQPASRPQTAADEIVGLINSPAPESPIAGDSRAADIEVGTYLPRESISPELEKTCDELREYIQERDPHPQVETSPGELAEPPGAKKA